jgi:hypothetical protein
MPKRPEQKQQELVLLESLAQSVLQVVPAQQAALETPVVLVTQEMWAPNLGLVFDYSLDPFYFPYFNSRVFNFSIPLMLIFTIILTNTLFEKSLFSIHL